MGRARFGFGALLVAAAVVLVTAPVAAADTEDNSRIDPAECGPGSLPETGLQGQVPRADRDSGRAARGYRCNFTLIGGYQGQGAGSVNPSYQRCAYFGTFFPSVMTADHPGVHVVDATDPRRPRFARSLASPAFLSGTWEGLKVHPGRGYLAAVGAPAPPGTGGMLFDLYDIKDDCAKPKLLNGLAGPLTVPTPALGHEGAFSPDGQTYYATAGFGGTLTAIDVSNPAHPRVVFSGVTGPANHGFSISPDGRTMYGVTITPGGVQVLDIGDIQDRKPLPQLRQIGQVTWPDSFATQHTLNFTKDGHQYLFSVDEAGIGPVRLLDIDDPTQPRVLREYRLQIQQPSAAEQRKADDDNNGIFGYDAHYCSINRRSDPSRLACGYIESGIRLYDISDLMKPRELAYYIPPAQTGLSNKLRLRNSPHSVITGLPSAFDANDMLRHPRVPKPTITATTDWCSSPPEFKSDDELWVSCMDNGFMALRYQPR